jgi:hypothetical protein
MTVFREKIDISNTRNLIGAYKVITTMQYLPNWAETVWRPIFTHLVVALSENE